MPTYKYDCKECGTEFSEMRKIEDRDFDVKCHECGSPKVERQTVYATDHILKGVGWARDGYKGKRK